MAEHGKGEWELVDDGVGLYLNTGPTSARWDCPADCDYTQEDYANGLLMASAPDLLEAAKYALQWVMEVDPDVHPSLPQMLKAAISKAQGE